MDEYTEKIRTWWRNLDGTDKKIIHDAAVADTMDADTASRIINSPGFVAGPAYVQWMSQPHGEWVWSERLRETIISEGM